MFYRPVSNSVKDILSHSYSGFGSFCFSFRLGLNTIVQDYRDQRKQPPLRTYGYSMPNGSFIKWSWRTVNPFLNYGYPISMDGHMYRKSDLIRMTSLIKMDSLRDWESQLCTKVHKEGQWNSYMSSFDESCVVNIPVNCVQDSKLHIGKQELSNGELNDRFLKGHRLSLDKMDFSDVRGCHQEIDLEWQ